MVDCLNPQSAVQQMEVVYDTLQELKFVGEKKTITLFNKVDMGAAIRMRDSNADHTLKVSAKTGEGLEDLKALLGKILSEEQIYVENFTYQEAGKIQLIREYGQLLSEESQILEFGESQSATGNSWEAYRCSQTRGTAKSSVIKLSTSGG